MKRVILYLMSLLCLCACNTVHIKPNTLEKNATIYSTRGGYTLRPAIKELMQQRGYDIKIGKVQDTNDMFESAVLEGEFFEIPESAQYVMRISENSERFRPIWCAFNGFWWWRFYVSIVEQQTGDEILIWTGRGCANSTLRKMNRILDELEKNE